VKFPIQAINISMDGKILNYCHINLNLNNL
jgi:hypothetical protein